MRASRLQINTCIYIYADMRAHRIAVDMSEAANERIHTAESMRKAKYKNIQKKMKYKNRRIDGGSKHIFGCSQAHTNTDKLRRAFFSIPHIWFASRGIGAHTRKASHPIHTRTGEFSASQRLLHTRYVNKRTSTAAAAAVQPHAARIIVLFGKCNVSVD